MLNFPTQPSSFLIPGPAGQLEGMVEFPRDREPASIAAGQPWVVVCHPNPTLQGTMNNKVVTTTCKAFQQLGLMTVRFNYRGVGNSTGAYGHYTGECEDLLAVVAWVRAAYPTAPLWLAGFSFGSFIAYRMANTLGAAQLLSIAPALNFENYRTVPEPTMPWTVVLPEADEVVDVAATRAWLAQVQAPYTLLPFPSVSHFFHGQLVALRERLVEHYCSLLP